MKYSPHKYQTYATDFILEHPVSAVFLDMGLGKSIITLTAIFDLCLDSFLVRKVLVIAPLRVAADTWPGEIEKWDHLRGLTYSVAVGSEVQRKAALLQRASVYIINRENVGWLVESSGLPFDYDMVVIDELSSFKSYQAKRFRALLKVRPRVKRIMGLTGTPSSNGLMDLWAEFRVLDMGKRLGRFITHYRTAFFQPDKRNAQVVFSYKPLPGAEDAIYEKISDITISMRAGDYLDMPECVINEVKVTLSEKEWKAYDTMRSELVLSLGGEEVDAGNAAALANKLSQMANGAVYGEDKKILPLHDRMNELLSKVKENLILEHDADDKLLERYITAAISYAESYQHIAAGYYQEHPMPPTTEQAVIMLSSHFYESRDGSTGGFFADNVQAGQQVWNTVNLLLRLDREWKV